MYWSNQHPNFPAGGKLTQWLESQPIGTMVEAKGPTGHFHYLGRGRYASGSLTVHVKSSHQAKAEIARSLSRLGRMRVSGNRASRRSLLFR